MYVAQLLSLSFSPPSLVSLDRESSLPSFGFVSLSALQEVGTDKRFQEATVFQVSIKFQVKVKLFQSSQPLFPIRSSLATN